VDDTSAVNLRDVVLVPSSTERTSGLFAVFDLSISQSRICKNPVGIWTTCKIPSTVSPFGGSIEPRPPPGTVARVFYERFLH